MAKKKKMIHTNHLAGISKDDIICEFAYSLVTAQKGSPCADTRDFIYAMWKNMAFEEDLSEKQLRKYRIRGLMSSDDFSYLASALKGAAADDHMLGAIITRVFMDFTAYLERKSGAFDADSDPDMEGLSEEEKLRMILGTRARINWGRVRADWGPAIAYIRTFASKEKYIEMLKERNIAYGGFYMDFIDAVFDSDGGMLWFVDRSDAVTDKQRISRYTNDCEFFRLCMRYCYERLQYVQSDFLFASASSVYGSYRGYALESLADDAGGMRWGYRVIMDEEREASVLVMDRSEEPAKITEDIYIDHWIAQEMLKEAYGYARAGVDILYVCREAGLTPKDASDAVKEAFLVRELWTDEITGYKSRRDQAEVIRLMVRIWIQKCIEKKLPELIRQKKGGAKAEESKYRKLAESLGKDIRSLELKLKKAESGLEKETRKTQEAAKEVLALKSREREIAKERDEELKRRDEEIDDLKLLIETLSAEESEDGEDLSDAAEESFRTYIKEHKVLIWGLREETERKFRGLFPELSFASSDRRLTRQQLTAYDAIIIATNNTGHGNFYAARDAANAVGLPRAYLDKTANTPEKLFKALEIAVRGRN